MTLRLSAFFEERIRKIISDYKTAVKSSLKLRRSQRFKKRTPQQEPIFPPPKVESTRYACHMAIVFAFYLVSRMYFIHWLIFHAVSHLTMIDHLKSLFYCSENNWIFFFFFFFSSQCPFLLTIVFDFVLVLSVRRGLLLKLRNKLNHLQPNLPRLKPLQQSIIVVRREGGSVLPTRQSIPIRVHHLCQVCLNVSC